jgi:type IV pilus assembly protein PilW
VSRRARSHRRQRGLSLIELMITMTLSSFLIIGATQIYLDNKSSYLFFKGQTQNQDSGRYILDRLQSRLDKAGYRRLPSTRMSAAFPAASSKGCSFAAGPALVRVDDSTLCLRYQPRDASDRTCAGSSLSAVTGVATPYTLFDPSNNVVEKITVANNVLTCNGTTLAENVMGIRFDYGIDDTSDESARKVSRYATAPASGKIVRSLRFAVLLASEQSNVSGGMAGGACSDWTALAGSNGTCSDSSGALHRIATGSVALRNLMP